MMDAPVDFQREGNYLWWDMTEVVGYERDDESIVLACCATKDKETKIISLNLEAKTHENLQRVRQDMHPRSIIQIFNSSIVLTVGLVDEEKPKGGCVDLIDVTQGEKASYLDKCRLCSVTSIKLIEDIQSGNDIEYIICGSSDKKIVEYIYKDASLSRVQEIETVHKKSIFGICTLNETTAVSIGLDGKAMAHRMKTGSYLPVASPSKLATTQGNLLQNLSAIQPSMSQLSRLNDSYNGGGYPPQINVLQPPAEEYYEEEYGDEYEEEVDSYGGQAQSVGSGNYQRKKKKSSKRRA